MPDPLPWDQFCNDNPVTANSSDPVLVIGAGLAGCWMARTLAEQGISVTILEEGPEPASGASSNPAGIVKPFVTRSPSRAMNFYVAAHQYLLQTLHRWDLANACSFNACGVVQLVDKPYPESDHYQRLSPQQVSQISGSKQQAHGLLFDQSGWLNPNALCHALLEHPLIGVHCKRKVGTIKRISSGHWELMDNRKTAWRTMHAVICSGFALKHLSVCKHLPLIPARGQISRFSVTPEHNIPNRVVSGKHYFIPDGDSLIVGATFQRDVCDASVNPDDDQSNRSALTAMLPSLAENASLIKGFAGIRATTPDRLPLVGPVPDAQACREHYADIRHGRSVDSYPALPVHAGVHVLGGLGSRGLVTAPMAAQLLVDHLIGGSAISRWTPLINPVRFQIKALKRGITSTP